MTDVSNADDTIDSRDVIARIEELEDELAFSVLDKDAGYTIVIGGIVHDMNDENEELEVLKALAGEAENCCDWEDGATLIRDTYFTQYAQEFADDIGAISSEHQWPLDCIDWEKAADDLKMNFSAVDFDDVTFWVSQ